MNLKEFILESTIITQLQPGENERENSKIITTFLLRKSLDYLEKDSPSLTGGMNTKKDIGNQQLLVTNKSIITSSLETESL